MAKNKNKKKGKVKRSKAMTSSHYVDVVAGNAQSSFWSAADECAHYAALGCHIANIDRCRRKNDSNSKSRRNPIHAPSYACSELEEMYELAMRQYPWLLGMERFDPSEYHPQDIERIPEVAMNDGEDGAEDMTLTLTNVTKNTTSICFVTVYDVDLCGADGNNILTSGVTSVTTSIANAADGHNGDTGSATATVERKCTTFIVLCPPQTFVHLCSLAPNQSQQYTEAPITSWSQVEIENDVQTWSSHPNIDDEHPYLIHFPFCGLDKETSDGDASYQCTQSEHGQLTHFFHGNYHAIDFACPIGTPLYSPANGTVVDVRDKQPNRDEKCIGGNSENFAKVVEVSGIAARNLFHWNSIMIRVDDKYGVEAGAATPTDGQADPLFVEFVHIQTNSCAVKVGDVVKTGQLLCRSGSAGFSPEPHLHLAAYRSTKNDAATVRVRFECVPSGGCGENGSGGDANAADNSLSGGGKSGENALPFSPKAGGWYSRSGLKD